MAKRITAYLHAYVGMGREAGAETTIANLLESLVADGWEAEVLLYGADPYIFPYEVNGVSVRMERSGEDLVLAKADVFISHLECSERAALLGKQRKIPTVQLIHNTMWQTEGYLNEGCDLAVFNTEWVREFHETPGKKDAVGVAYRDGDSVRIDFKQRKPTKWESIVVHPQIDPSLYRSAGGAHKYITLVNLFEPKGAGMFWQLAELFPDLPFMAVKGGYGDQMIPKVIPKNVKMVKNTPDMAGIYAASRVMVMPSTYESFGRVAIEAAAAGVPTIASGTPGLEEALGPEGTFCAPDDVDAWAYRVFELMYDDAKYIKASAAALERSEYWARALAPETAKFVETMNRIATPKNWGYSNGTH